MQLNGTRVWIVGASSGIGAALADELHSRGAQVAISARRMAQLTEVSRGRMVEVTADVTDQGAVANAAAAVRAQLGEIDAVVVASGYWQRADGRSWDCAEFDRHVAVNVTGLSHVIGAVMPDMVRRGRGTFAAVASVAGYRGVPGAEYYGATKAAQICLLESLRASVAGCGVHVTTICPGFVRTDMTSSNTFPMPFIIPPEAAARSIADGLAHDRHEIVFPAPMAILMKAARWAPVGIWARAVRR
ncbi:putative oxidoreductase [Austwickia sp. TVS 96-490-7B]|uniref:SDR family NAD(P)-dependent oxidoreductase n=1 Tax=Austwickia sp. TVS 96-490-7B TaxID=2830843 RepID=UPI001C591744|nr:SDR family NAD(P)-dependent oxidoreductase [Austwickia sp. TVS 96-490-7B]MBW3084529.1 putative oxidoreductase [Austwickia sp. TVS 96-490-7B]